MSLDENAEGNGPNPEFGYWFRASFSPYVVHAAASLACVLIFVWTLHFHAPVGFSGADVFNFHPLLQSLAFVLIIPESILVLRFSGFNRTVSKPFHAGLHALAVILALCGVAAAYKYKVDVNGAHFRSLHSWLGLATIVMLLAQWFFGAFLFYRARGSTRFNLAPIHIHIGHVIVFTSAGALLTGIMERLIFDGACIDHLSRECAIANVSGLSIIITFVALGVALTAGKRPASRLIVNEPLLGGEADVRLVT